MVPRLRYLPPRAGVGICQPRQAVQRRTCQPAHLLPPPAILTHCLPPPGWLTPYSLPWHLPPYLPPLRLSITSSWAGGQAKPGERAGNSRIPTPSAHAHSCRLPLYTTTRWARAWQARRDRTHLVAGDSSHPLAGIQPGRLPLACAHTPTPRGAWREGTDRFSPSSISARISSPPLHWHLFVGPAGRHATLPLHITLQRLLPLLPHAHAFAHRSAPLYRVTCHPAARHAALTAALHASWKEDTAAACLRLYLHLPRAASTPCIELAWPLQRMASARRVDTLNARLAADKGTEGAEEHEELRAGGKGRRTGKGRGTGVT